MDKTRIRKGTFLKGAPVHFDIDYVEGDYVSAAAPDAVERDDFIQKQLPSLDPIRERIEALKQKIEALKSK